jgi:diguanylate cyclase (GGDEF)-like protein/PAS domain S-box-containing protein
LGEFRALATNGPIDEDRGELVALTQLGSAAACAGTPVASEAGSTSAPARLGVPLPGARGSLGAICISADPGRSYAEEDQHFLESVANLVGLTLERIHAVDELRHEHAQSFQLLRAVPSVLIGTDGNGVVHLWNQAAVDTLSLEPEAVIGRQLAESALPFDIGDIQRRIGRAANVGAPVTDDLRFTRNDGTKGYMSLTVTRVVDEDARPAGHLLVGTDITQRRELEEQLRHQALHDPLTDLANRALFRDRLEHALSRFHLDLPSLAVLFIDLDDFKAVNDSLGHQMGDRLLTAASARLQSTLRPSDTLARLGGDEFAILLEGVDSREVDRVASELLREMARPFKIDDRELRLSASVGMAAPLSESESADDLLRNADIAMYAAKERGKARAVVFDATLHSQALERIELESDLRVAVERNELRVDFQPIVELTTGEATGAEALVRWQHPTRGLMSPAWFIPTAERSGQVSAIDLWVLRQACAQIRDWTRVPGRVPLHIAVNLSRTDLDRPEVVDEVRQTLAEFGVDPSSIVLEVTESALAEDMDSAIERLKALKTTGVRIAIDDFGTGYSSLGSLQHLPVDILKIDKSFVDALEGGSPEGEEVVSAIIRIARVLKLQTVAEGVETWAQAQRLRRLGCDLGQGYYFARPMAAEAAWRVIEESRAAQQHTA